jgi:hypothetical protein
MQTPMSKVARFIVSKTPMIPLEFRDFFFLSLWMPGRLAAWPRFSYLSQDLIAE